MTDVDNGLLLLVLFRHVLLLFRVVVIDQGSGKFKPVNKGPDFPTRFFRFIYVTHYRPSPHLSKSRFLKGKGSDLPSLSYFSPPPPQWGGLDLYIIQAAVIEAARA